VGGRTSGCSIVRDGPRLSDAVRGQVLRTAELPPKFSSYRNLMPASAQELLETTLPTVRDMAMRLASAPPAR